jgi:hypothetical protein
MPERVADEASFPTPDDAAEGGREAFDRRKDKYGF